MYFWTFLLHCLERKSVSGLTIFVYRYFNRKYVNIMNNTLLLRYNFRTDIYIEIFFRYMYIIF